MCVEAFPRLYSFSLLSSQVTDAGAEHLRGAARLHFLYLPFTNLTDKGLLHLQGLAELEVLDLSATKITDAGLEHLKGLRKLRCLYLDHTQVTDVGLECLKDLAQLQRLRLYDTKVTEDGVRRLHRALSNCEIDWSGSTSPARSGPASSRWEARIANVTCTGSHRSHCRVGIAHGTEHGSPGFARSTRGPCPPYVD